MRWRAAVLAALVALAAAAPTFAAPPPAADAPIRLVRSVSGTRGSQRGDRFEVEDPRTVFTLPQDRVVLVYFEWEGGTPGMRHYEGRWKDPSGAVVLVAPTDQRVTGRRFGIYWTVSLPETAAPGLWAIEAFVDGTPAGTHAFEVRGERAAAALTAAQLDVRARTAAATVERLGPSGEITGLGVATALNGDLLVSPFSAIDGATVVRVVLPDGRGWKPGRSAQLAAQGHFMRPLSPESRHVISGVFAGRVQRGGVVPMPLDQRTSFARREGHVFVFVQWNPQDKRQTASTYEVYDADNKLLARSEQAQLKFKRGELLFSTWSFPIDRLAPGVYRVDLLLAAEPVWRGWVRVTD